MIKCNCQSIRHRLKLSLKKKGLEWENPLIGTNWYDGLEL